ncbi:RNA polymerase-binding protein RbpA [Allokutzneria oryzae]|uniref:RNA polymerase-binding protein RbpA n=1 Tax=Allokutzneria oryzae TaxID=1378989 RepID=A0ABV5ZRS5_9PSEU
MKSRLRGRQVGGSVSYEADRDHDLAKRRIARYGCPGHRNAPRSHEFEVLFAAEGVVIPDEWRCRWHGVDGLLLDPVQPRSGRRPAERSHTHWDMLRERRSIADLERLLDERLAKLHAGTAGAAQPETRQRLRA